MLATRLVACGLIALLTSGCAELIFSGISAGVGLIGVGQRHQPSD